ncbi:ATP-binding protein [Variovorax sp. ZS18.2.2]|uniref:sensor histidine kinase n=1 Tax=Variovorax sp. ZS18.2.2 TaxID=2971255 RepID=UPI0021519E82|nr:ATP-binding protein [Variovorax sp. ZS18.2.2]MCR6477358.1 ATP-binding protein [Variovorax sp. ZS18.2.2]
MKSLQGRMLVVLGATILLCWAVALAVLFVYVRQNQASIWDNKLESMATRVLLAIPAKTNLPDARRESLQLRPDALPKNDQLAFQVWVDRTRLSVRTPGAPATPLRPDFAEGIATTVIDGERWRVYSVSDSMGRIYVQVGNLQRVVDSDLRAKAFIALAINTVLLALVGGLMWVAVRHSLKPVTAMQATLRERQTFDLTPVPMADLPSELRPLVASFNHLLDQLDKAVEGERRFIGDAAHELRTPLSALQAQAQVAMQATTVAEKNVALAKLLLVVERSVRLSEQMLDLARLNAGAIVSRHVPVDLSELVLYVAREFEVHAKQQGRSIFLAIESGWIACDIDEIGILLRNLVDNSLRHTPAGARIRIACGVVLEGGVTQVFLEVADDGPGVPEAEREAIFERFHRVAGTGSRGSGIGLSLVAGIANLHRATVRTGEGLDGRGFSVRILFPASDRAA